MAIVNIYARVNTKELHSKLDAILQRMAAIEAKENEIMGKLEDANAKIDEIKAQVAILNTALDGTRAVVSQMQAELADLKSGAVLSDEVNQKVDAIIANADTALAEVKATYDENFPATPPSNEPGGGDEI